MQILEKILKRLKWPLGIALPGYIFFQGYKKYKSRPSQVRILVNPLAGEGEAKITVKKIRKALNKRMPESKIDIIFSRTKGDLSTLAKEAVRDECEMVVAVGGDGAINEVIQGLAGSSVVLGIIPRGTGNVFAQEMKIPNNIDQACKILETGEIRRVDLGKVSDRYFLWLAGIGVDALVAQELTSEAKDKLGIFSYFIFALKHLKKIPYTKININCEGVESNFKALCLFAGNATSYDGKLNIKSVDSMDDGYLDVCIAQKVTPLGIIRQILWFLIGRKTYYRDIQYFDVIYLRAKKLRIQSEPPVFVHTDGEVIGQTPCECTIEPSSLSIIFPCKV